MALVPREVRDAASLHEWGCDDGRGALLLLPRLAYSTHACLTNGESGGIMRSNGKRQHGSYIVVDSIRFDSIRF